MQRNKISVIGAGNVGASLAQALAIEKLGDIFLFDVVDGIPEGKALDIQEGAPHWGFDLQIKGFTTTNPKVYENLKGSDVVEPFMLILLVASVEFIKVLLKYVSVFPTVPVTFAYCGEYRLPFPLS